LEGNTIDQMAVDRIGCRGCRSGIVVDRWLRAASADPDLGPIVNTTCNYSQVMGALNAQNPAAAGKFNSSPIAQSYLRQFLAAPPSERQAMAQQAMSTPGAAQQFGLVQQVAATCNNF
jgi:hemophore-related protein